MRITSTIGPAILLWIAPGLLNAQEDYMEDDLLLPPTLEILSLVPLWSGTEWYLAIADEQSVVVIEESCGVTSTVLLPILFADHPGDETISERYRLARTATVARDYTDTNAVWGWDGELAKYYELPDIIGYRLAHHPTATIGLRGGYSGEVGESAAIASARVVSVRDHLTDVWSIEPERITILEPRRLSDSADHLLRHEEARCVAIETESWEIVRPVRYIVRDRRISGLNLRFAIDPRVPPHLVKRVAIVITIGGLVVGEASMEGHVDSLRYRRDGSWTPYWNKIEVTGGAVTVTALVTMSDGHVRRSSSIALSTRYEPCDATPSDYSDNTVSLPFFAFRDTLLSSFQKRLLRQIVDDYDTAGTISFSVSEEIEFSEGEGEENEQWNAVQLARLDQKRGQQQEQFIDRSLGRLRFSEADDYLPLVRESQGTLWYTLYAYFENADDPDRLRSLGATRAHSVGSYLRDSLGISATDEQWRKNRRRDEQRKKGRERDLLRRSPSLQYEYYLRPEERWYARQVILRVEINEEAMEEIEPR